MKTPPLLYISSTGCQGSHGDGWSQEWNGNQELPAVSAIMEQLDERVFAQDKLMVLLQDAWLNPLSIQLEEKVARKDLNQFLIWKLKRFLPYPADQVELRHLPLTDGSYLTFSLPKPWLADLFDRLSKRGVHCGYIGGMASTLLENRSFLHGRVNLCMFSDSYLLSEMDGQGNYVGFKIRRLPYDMSDQLDVNTLINSDVLPMVRKQDQPLTMINFEPALNSEFEIFHGAMEATGSQVQRADLHGPTLARFQSCWAGQGGLA